MKKAILSIGFLALTTILFSWTGTRKEVICHQLGNGNTITIEVADDAVQAHLDHGDYFGDCGNDNANPDNGNTNLNSGKPINGQLSPGYSFP